MRRILLVGKAAPDRGGIAAFIGSLLDSDLGTRFTLELLNLTRREVPRSGRMTLANVRRTLSDAAAVLRASRRGDIVHIHTALVPHVTLLRACLLACAARARGARVIVHAHSGKVQRWIVSPGRRLLVRIALLPADRLIAVSEGGRRALEQAVGEPVLLVENGVASPPHAEPRSPDAVPTILFAGVLTPRKGVVDLLNASRILMQRGIAHEVVLAGGTPDEGPDAEAAVRAASEGAAARFVGPQPHEAMWDLYAEADVFCLPSWWEAMPLSVLEAMASGRPVVATAVGDVARAVRDGETGLLVPVRSPEALADALGSLLRDPELRAALGSAARRLAEAEFSIAATVAAMDAVYTELR